MWKEEDIGNGEEFRENCDFEFSVRGESKDNMSGVIRTRKARPILPIASQIMKDSWREKKELEK